MKYVLFVLLALVACAAQAQQPVRTYTSMPCNATAQGVAELCARNRVLKHWGGNRGLEGVGSGSTPEQALRNCCYSNSGRQVVDQGVAFGGGRWFACKRYR
jgi:hypothetical protein